MFEEVYTKKENAVQIVRDLYLNGKSIIEIKDLIKSESLIEFDLNSNTAIGIFMIECFCLDWCLNLIMTLFSLKPDQPDYEYYLNHWSKEVANLIKESKPK